MSTHVPLGASIAAVIGTIVATAVIFNQHEKDEPKRESERRADNRANNIAVLKTIAQRAHQDTELAKKGRVRVGMITEQCRMAWGEPDHINRTTDARGEHEHGSIPVAIAFTSIMRF